MSVLPRKPVVSLLSLAAAAILSGCGGGGSASLVAAPPPPPVGGGNQGGQTFNIERCFNQAFGALSLNGRITPDVLTIDLSQPAGFPNGRMPQDPVIDITLSALFLDQARHGLRTLANIPLNPPGVDKPISTSFPFLAPPHGNPPLSPTNGINFNFRTEPASAFTQLDRMGNPAIATIMILSGQKNAYNDVQPSADVAGQFRQALRDGLTAVHNQIDDDLQRLGLTPCSLGT